TVLGVASSIVAISMVFPSCWNTTSELSVFSSLVQSSRAVRFKPRAIPCAWAFQNLGGWSDDHMQYPLEVPNRAARIFRMAGHMLGQRLLLFLLHDGLVVSFVDDGMQPFPLRRN